MKPQTTEQERDALAAQIANKIYEQFVTGAANSAMMGWVDKTAPLPDNDPVYRKIALWARSLPTNESDMVHLLVGRVAADAMFHFIGLFNSFYGLGAINGELGVFEMSYDGENIGADIAWHLRQIISDGQFFEENANNDSPS